MPFPRSTLAHHRLQTLGLFLEKMKSLGLISFELLVVSRILLASSIIMVHDNSKHNFNTIHTVRIIVKYLKSYDMHGNLLPRY